MPESIKVVSNVIARAHGYSSTGGVDFGKKIEKAVNDGYEVKAAGCSGAGYGDVSDAHICVAILQKNVEKLEER